MRCPDCNGCLSQWDMGPCPHCRNNADNKRASVKKMLAACEGLEDLEDGMKAAYDMIMEGK